jgi:FkbM family methyltransferase
MVSLRKLILNYKSLLSTTKRIFNFLGIGVTSLKNLEQLKQIAFQYESLESDFQLIQDLSKENWPRVVSLLKESKSQIKQDLFVLSILDFKRNGFFVEFGAADGVRFSNSYLLAKRFGWKGILAEPAKSWHKTLNKNREESTISYQCVWRESGLKIEFSESDTPELSTISSYKTLDFHRENRSTGRTYLVETISLTNLLEENNSPQQIDYLSIDTEGTELEILEAFDFTKYQISIITCEHNYSDKRDRIRALIESNGFKRVLESHSQFDDWFINTSLVKN